jgi:cell division protease FtsH
MEKQPPPDELQGPPQKHNVPRTDAPGGSPTPAWLWLLLLGGFGLIFYQFAPKAEIQVSYHPWFDGQVQADNIKTCIIEGTEIRGELRKAQPYQRTPDAQPIPVRRFLTNAPSVASVDAIVKKLIERDSKRTPEEQMAGQGTRIDVQPAASPNNLMWMMVFLTAFVILVIVFLVVRRVRG